MNTIEPNQNDVTVCKLLLSECSELYPAHINEINNRKPSITFVSFTVIFMFIIFPRKSDSRGTVKRLTVTLINSYSHKRFKALNVKK